MALAITAAQSTFAGGLLTNTNQNVAFNRHFSRDATIGIDGVYSNPAGVGFLAAEIGMQKLRIKLQSEWRRKTFSGKCE